MQEIFHAIKQFNLQKVEKILAEGAYPNQIKNEMFYIRPLHEAVIAAGEGGPIEMIKLLLKYKADINATHPDLEGGTPLLVALFNNFVDIAQFLLDAGADPNISSDEGNYPLHWSVDNNNLEITKFLLAKGAWRTIDEFSAI